MATGAVRADINDWVGWLGTAFIGISLILNVVPLSLIRTHYHQSQLRSRDQNFRCNGSQVNSTIPRAPLSFFSAPAYWAVSDCASPLKAHRAFDTHKEAATECAADKTHGIKNSGMAIQQPLAASTTRDAIASCRTAVVACREIKTVFIAASRPLVEHKDHQLELVRPQPDHCGDEADTEIT